MTPDTQLVIEGFPRSANTFARVAFNRASGAHRPRSTRSGAGDPGLTWRIPTLVLIRKPKDAVLSFAIRDPISVDQALRYYLSFYETVEEYRDAYVLGLFEEVTEDFGEVIRRINDRFGTTFSPFSHDERNVDGVFARIEKTPGRGSGRHRWRTRSLALRLQREAQARNGIRTGEPETY